MKIRNETHWRTDHLRAIAGAVASRVLDPEHRRALVVTFVYSRSGWDGISGEAPYGKEWRYGVYGYHAIVRIPSGNLTSLQQRWMARHPNGEIDAGDGTVIAPSFAREPFAWTVERKRNLALVIEHEIRHGALSHQHTGTRGDVMSGTAASNAPSDRYAYVDGLPIEKSAPKVRVPVDLEARRAAKIAHAEAMQAKWEAKMKSAGRHVAKWHSRVRDLGRQQRAAAVKGRKD